MSMFTSPRERRLWLWALTVTVTIFATLGQVPAVARALQDRDLVDDVFFVAFVVIVVAVIVAGLSTRPGWREVTVVVAAAGAYLMAFLRFTHPAERTHLVEFGVVAILVYAALLERRDNGTTVRHPALVAFVITATLGLIDEGIQWLLPNRFFDVVDIAFNLGAAAMAIAVVAALRWARARRGTGTDRRT